MRRITVLSAAIVTTLTMLVSAASATRPTAARAATSVTIVAHRGATELAPENSMPALVAAARAGFDVETDVHWTRTGIPLILHDFTLDRTTTCTGAPETYTWTYLRSRCRIDKGTNVDLFATLRVPSLGGLLHALAAFPVHVELELKTAPDAAQAAKLLTVVGNQHMTDRVMFKTGDESVVATMGEYLHSQGSPIPTGLQIRSYVDATALRAELPYATYLLPDPVLLTSDYVAALHGEGFHVIAGVYSGASDVAADWTAYAATAIDGLTTNHPYGASAVLAASGP